MKRKLIELLAPVPAHLFITLSCNPGPWRDPTEAFRGMSTAVNILVKRIRRHWAKASFEYFLVWETTSNGWPHAHLIARGPYIPQSWLSAQWSELTHAYIVDIRTVKGSGGLVSYLAKYLSKKLAAPPGFKRYRMSRGFLLGSSMHRLLHPPRGSGFRIVRDNCMTLAKTWERSGRSVSITRNGGGHTPQACPKGCPCVYEIEQVRAS